MRNNVDTVWTDEKMARLKLGYQNDELVEKIAADLGLNPDQVKGKAYRLCLKRPEFTKPTAVTTAHKKPGMPYVPPQRSPS